MIQLLRRDFKKKNNSQLETAKSVAVIVTFLFAYEHILRYVAGLFADSSPALASANNRNILSRHIAVDLSCCFFVTWCGCDAFGELSGFWKKLPASSFDKRLFGHNNAGHQIALYYLAYQFKNMYDTIVWNDGPEFIMVS